MACGNAVSALTLPWTNVTVQASSNVPVRGVSFGVGTPAQTISLWPSFYDNDTWVPNSLDCNDLLSNLSCIAVDGGIYYTSNSSTYKFASQSNWNGSQTLNGIHTYLNDNAHIASDTVIWGMPLVQHVVNFDFQSALGLGPSSTFLKSLVSQNLAPSTNFGIWSGSQSVDNPVDGSLIVGGFDESKVGSLTNFSSIPGCMACAVVSSLEVTLSNGSTASLLNATVPHFNINIDPYYNVAGVPVMAVPDEIRDMLVAATDSVHLDSLNVYGWRGGQQPGDVRVTFNNGYQVTMSGAELWLPPRSVNSAGQPTIQNSNQTLNVLRASGKYDPTVTYPWGQPFLSSNYMIVWPDEDVWSLSPISSEQKTASQSVKNLCGDSGPSAPGSNASHTSSGSHAGAIAGGVVGGILGLAIVLAAFWFFRRRAKRRANNYQPSRTELQNTDTGYRQKFGDTYYSEGSSLPKKSLAKHSDNGVAQVAQELPAHDDPFRTPSEMPGSPDRLAELPADYPRR